MSATRRLANHVGHQLDALEDGYNEEIVEKTVA
jgi:hypothetical protein